MLSGRMFDFDGDLVEERRGRNTPASCHAFVQPPKCEERFLKQVSEIRKDENQDRFDGLIFMDSTTWVGEGKENLQAHKFFSHDKQYKERSLY